jgi:hypothetical protein
MCCIHVISKKNYVDELELQGWAHRASEWAHRLTGVTHIAI